MADVFQASIKAAAVGGILFIWANYTIEAFKFAWHIVSISPEKETWKAVTKVPCENCKKYYDDDEYGLIYGTHLCEACRQKPIEKKIFYYINMPVNAFWKGFLDGVGDGILFAGATYVLVSAASLFVDNLIDQDEQIEELFSRLEKCGKKNMIKKNRSRNYFHDLKNVN